jgi:hypothetical protein
MPVYPITVAVEIQDTLKNVLNNTPVSGMRAWATDFNVLLVANGTNWSVASGYLTQLVQNPDMGFVSFSDRIGYGRDYVTDKLLANCAVGANANTTVGGLRFNSAINELQVYFNGQWNTLAPIELRDNPANTFYPANIIAEHLPNQGVGFVTWIDITSGNSDEVFGLNGLPVVMNNKASMGAYPFPNNINGGSF